LDHMHDVRLPGKRDARFEVGDIAGMGKDLAKEFGCPAVWLAQLNRGLENRADKRPTMADLRESGEIEQKADVIWFLYREDYYQRNTPGWQRQHAVELILGKGRDLNVEDANVTLRAEFEFMRMSDWDWARHGPIPDRVKPKAAAVGFAGSPAATFAHWSGRRACPAMRSNSGRCWSRSRRCARTTIAARLVAGLRLRTC